MKSIIRLYIKLLIAFLVITMAARAQEDKPNPETGSLYRSEKEFSAYCVMHWIKDGSLGFTMGRVEYRKSFIIRMILLITAIIFLYGKKGWYLESDPG